MRFSIWKIKNTYEHSCLRNFEEKTSSRSQSKVFISQKQQIVAIPEVKVISSAGCFKTKANISFMLSLEGKS